MADTVTFQSATPSTPPDTTVIATDDAGAGGHVQIVKLAVSTDGSATALTANNTDGLLVNLGSNNDVTITGSVDTELPAAAALADDAANPTAPAVGAFVMGYDGTTWDRIRGDSTNGLDVRVSNVVGVENADGNASLAIMDDWDESDRAKVNPIAGQAGVQGGSGTVSANTQRVVLATDVALPAGTNNIGDVDVASIAAGDNNIGNVDIVTMPAVTNGGTFAVQEDGAALTALQKIDDPVIVDDNAFTPATSSVMMAGFEADEGSTDSVDEGDAGAARMTLDRKVIVSPQPHTAGGLSIFRSLDLDESEEEIKGTAGQIYGWYIANLATSTRFIKIYNATAANVTVGTTTPVITIPIPGNSSDDIAANALGSMGITFDTAITIAATTGLADNDTGAPGANEVVVNVFYK